MGEKVEHILLITLSCVGDVVMTTPVLQSLHEKYPEARVDIVADRRSSMLLSLCPYRGNIIHKDKSKLFRGAIDLVKDLRRKPYDLVVDLRTDGVAYLLKAKKRFTKWNKQAYGPHAVQELMGIIRKIHGEDPIPDTIIWWNENHEDYAKEVLSPLPGERWLALAPAVAAKSKRWPGRNYVELLNSLSDLFAGVMMVGSDAEREIIAAVDKELSIPSVNLAGADLLQTAASLKRASVFIGSDSGLGHIAAAVGTATVTLFGADFPERCLPWGSSTSWLKGEKDQVSDIAVADVKTKIRNANY